MKLRALAITACALAALTLPAAAAAPYHVGKTAWGDPDLQGIWTNASVTTLERPAKVKNLVLTPQEAAAMEAEIKGALAVNDEVGSPPAAAGDSELKQAATDKVGGYNSVWLDPGSKIAVVGGQFRSSWIVEPASGHVPYSAQGVRDMTAAAIPQFANFDGPEVRSLGERCIVGYGSTSGPPMLNVLYNNNYQFVQSPGFVTIVVEMNHDARVIRLGGHHVPPNIRPWMGDSIGHFEGDTLVVETTNLNPGQRFTADIRHRIYLAPDSKVTERFTRVSADTILYQFTVEEPKAYTQTWKGEIPMHATTKAMYEYACHEGNHAMEGILRGARVLEADAAAKKGASK